MSELSQHLVQLNNQNFQLLRQSGKMVTSDNIPEPRPTAVVQVLPQQIHSGGTAAPESKREQSSRQVQKILTRISEALSISKPQSEAGAY